MSSVVNKLQDTHTYRFEILPEFAGEEVSLSNKYIVPGKYALTCSIRYPVAKNEYLMNEIKAFVQHICIEKKYVSASIRDVFGDGLRFTTKFFNECYPEAYSVLDIPYEKLFASFLEFLEDNGVETYSVGVYHVRKDMNIKGYRCMKARVYLFRMFYRYIYDCVFTCRLNEYDKDVWDVRKLGIKYTLADFRKRYTLNFTYIQQEWLKKLIKKYVLYRLQNRNFSCVLDDIKVLKLFADFLWKEYPEVKNISQVNRDVAEKYIKHVSLRGYCVTSFNRRISVVKTFFSLGSIIGIGDFPKKPLLFSSDFRKVVGTIPNYYSANELSQINAHIGELPIQIARILFVIESHGMRLSDILSSKSSVNDEPCIKQTNQGEYVFTYYMPKTHRYNSIPITALVAEIINSAIADSKKKFGNVCQYIFAKSVDEPISVETFSHYMNELSFKYDMRRDDGKPLRITGHSFRRTVATKFANMGLEHHVICAMLGQKDLGVLKHYVKIHESSMLNMMKVITDADDKMISNIGRKGIKYVEKIEEPNLIPLPNGRCAKAIATGICSHADMCYGCRMFVPLKECMYIYKSQLQEVKSNIAIAEMHGYERILEINNRLEKQLEEIINRIS